MRNALFNTMGDITELDVFDPYCGSGAIAFEAISRGAASVQACEKDFGVYTTICESKEALGLGEEFQISKANCVSWLKQTGASFDLVIADPPHNDMSKKQLAALAPSVRKGGLLVICHPYDYKLAKPTGFDDIGSNRYGNARLSYYRKR